MKFTKRILAVGLLAIGALLFSPAPVQAQSSGVKPIIASGAAKTLTTNQWILAGLTNQLGGPTQITNIYSTNIIVSCGDYDNVGFTWKFDGISSTTNGTIVMRIFKSFDNGATYDYVPSYTFTYTAPTATTGAGTWIGTTTNLDMRGATHFAITRVNLTTDYLTNEFITADFKIPKVGGVPSTR